MAKKSKKQMVLEELAEFVRNSFNGLNLVISPNTFKLEFNAIKLKSKHLRNLDVYDYIFKIIIRETEMSYTFYTQYRNKLYSLFNYIKNKGNLIFCFHQDDLPGSVYKFAKEKYYSQNEEVRNFDNVLKSFLSLHSLSKSNRDLIEFRDLKSKQLDDLVKNNQLLIHKSIVIWDLIEKIKVEKYWNGEI